MSGVESALCLSGGVAINVTSTTDVESLVSELSCTGPGDFYVAWYSNLTLGQKIEVSNMKSVSVTGYGFPTIRGGVDEANDLQTGGGIFSVSYGSTLRISHLNLDGGEAENGGALELLNSSSLYIFDCSFTSNQASRGGETCVEVFKIE